MPTDEDGRAAVESLAGMFADVLAGGLDTTEQLARDDHSDWIAYTAAMMKTSPAIEYFVRQHPDWFPELLPYLPDGPSALSDKAG